jgi:hypothetical protein
LTEQKRTAGETVLARLLGAPYQAAGNAELLAANRDAPPHLSHSIDNTLSRGPSEPRSTKEIS